MEHFFGPREAPAAIACSACPGRATCASTRRKPRAEWQKVYQVKQLFLVANRLKPTEEG
ncbi:protein of unknown function (plasmid) [Rhodovastum atsumiense]|nr:protein of unknown function [Rhodovastum atsumiense]